MCYELDKSRMSQQNTTSLLCDNQPDFTTDWFFKHSLILLQFEPLIDGLTLVNGLQIHLCPSHEICKKYEQK